VQARDYYQNNTSESEICSTTESFVDDELYGQNYEGLSPEESSSDLVSTRQYAFTDLPINISTSRYSPVETTTFSLEQEGGPTEGTFMDYRDLRKSI